MSTFSRQEDSRPFSAYASKNLLKIVERRTTCRLHRLTPKSGSGETVRPLRSNLGYYSTHLAYLHEDDNVPLLPRSFSIPSESLEALDMDTRTVASFRPLPEGSRPSKTNIKRIKVAYGRGTVKFYVYILCRYTIV